MTAKPLIASSGNMMAPALATLEALGYVVSPLPGDGTLLRAESTEVTLVAEDPLLLLGLAKLFEIRGISWQASDAEIQTLLALVEAEET